MTGHHDDDTAIWLAGAGAGCFALGYAAATDLTTLIGTIPLAGLVVVPSVLELAHAHRRSHRDRNAARRIARNIDTFHRIT